MPRLVLLNGAPGCGKHTVAHAMMQRFPLTLALDLDTLQHRLGCWESDPRASRQHARMLACALVREQLGSGHDVFMSQFVNSGSFVAELEATAGDLGAEFREVFLVADAPTIADRIERLAQERPERLVHVTANRVVTPSDAPELVAAVEGLLRKRRSALRVNAVGDPEVVLERVLERLSSGPEGD